MLLKLCMLSLSALHFSFSGFFWSYSFCIPFFLVSLVIPFSVMLLSKPASSMSLPITYQSCDRISAHWLMYNMELDTLSGADEVSWDVMVAGQQLSPTVWSWLNMWRTVAVVQTVPVVSLFLGYCVPLFLFFFFSFFILCSLICFGFDTFIVGHLSVLFRLSYIVSMEKFSIFMKMYSKVEQ